MRRRVLSCSNSLVIVAVHLGVASSTFAQSQTDFPQFNFSPPGARSLGMGAAFIGLADDATASESNPAGLTILTAPELSLHGRLSAFQQRNVSGSVATKENSRVGSPSYVSAVFPKGRFTVAAYLQENARYATGRTSLTRGVTFLPFEPGSIACPGTCTSESSSEVGYVVRHAGASLAVKAGRRFSVGASLRRTRYQFDYRTSSKDTLDSPSNTAPADGRPVQTYPAGTVVRSFETTVDDHDDRWTYNVGFLINPSGRVAVGGVLRRGAGLVGGESGFEFDSIQRGSNVALRTPFGSLGNGFPVSARSDGPSTFPRSLGLPDVFGGGLSVRPLDQLTIAIDATRVRLSQAGSFFSGDVISGAEDVTNIHAGTEYLILNGQSPISLRAGFFSEGSAFFSQYVGARRARNYTAGAGMVFAKRFQVDAAFRYRKQVKSESGSGSGYRLSEESSKEALLSLIVRLQ